MVTHPRILENTVRKTDDRRKRKRAEKAQRKAAQESIQQEEVKRLKNIKGHQIQERCAACVIMRQRFMTCPVVMQTIATGAVSFV